MHHQLWPKKEKKNCPLECYQGGKLGFEAESLFPLLISSTATWILELASHALAQIHAEYGLWKSLIWSCGKVHIWYASFCGSSCNSPRFSPMLFFSFPFFFLLNGLVCWWSERLKAIASGLTVSGWGFYSGFYSCGYRVSGERQKFLSDGAFPGKWKLSEWGKWETSWSSNLIREDQAHPR